MLVQLINLFNFFEVTINNKIAIVCNVILVILLTYGTGAAEFLKLFYGQFYCKWSDFNR